MKGAVRRKKEKKKEYPSHWFLLLVLQKKRKLHMIQADLAGRLQYKMEI